MVNTLNLSWNHQLTFNCIYRMTCRYSGQLIESSHFIAPYESNRTFHMWKMHFWAKYINNLNVTFLSSFQLGVGTRTWTFRQNNRFCQGQRHCNINYSLVQIVTFWWTSYIMTNNLWLVRKYELVIFQKSEKLVDKMIQKIDPKKWNC